MAWLNRKGWSIGDDHFLPIVQYMESRAIIIVPCRTGMYLPFCLHGTAFPKGRMHDKSECTALASILEMLSGLMGLWIIVLFYRSKKCMEDCCQHMYCRHITLIFWGLHSGSVLWVMDSRQWLEYYWFLKTPAHVWLYDGYQRERSWII